MFGFGNGEIKSEYISLVLFFHAFNAMPGLSGGRGGGISLSRFSLDRASPLELLLGC